MARGRATGRWAAAVLLGLVVAGPAFAGDSGERGPLRKGQEEITFSGGYAFDVDPRRTRPAVPFYTFVPGYGRFFSPRTEMVFEVPVALYHTWDDAVSVGLNTTLRYHFTRLGRLSPFYEVGVGGMWTNLDDGNLGGDLHFIVNAGLGFRYQLRRNESVLLTGRFHHLSNGGFHERNRGINDVLVLVGYSRFLR